MGTIKYTVKCPIGQNDIFDHRWDSAGANKIFSDACFGNSSASSVVYQII